MIPIAADAGAASEGAQRRVSAACRGFLKALSQAVKVTSLYRPEHPVAVASVQDAWQHLHEVFAETGWPEACFGRAEERWVANDVRIAEGEAAFEVLALAFKGHAIRTVTFLPDAKAYELAAFCELASTPANRAYETDASDFLAQRGVRHVQVNVEEYARRRKRRPVHVLPVSPVPAAPPPPPDGGGAADARERPAGPAAGAPGTGAGLPGPGSGPAGSAAGTAGSAAGAAGRGFGTFIKSLVDEAVPDEAHRVQVYEEAVRLVRQALARRVHEATGRLQAQSRRSANELTRTENVLASVAHGKVIVDRTGRVLMMDAVAEELAGAPLSRVAGRPLLEGMPSGNKMVSLAEDMEVPDNRSISGKVRIVGDSGLVDAMRRSMAVVQDETGRFVGTVAVPPFEAKLRETLRMQEEFVSNVTHELKAPLASLCSALEAVEGKAASRLAPAENRLLEISLRNARSLRQLISEILDFSKIRSGRMSVQPLAVEAAALLRECGDGLLPWAESKRLVLEIDGNGEGLRVLADRMRAVQILNNLVSNAIKHTPEGGSIRLSVKAGEGEDYGSAVFCVADTGCGIASADLERVFEKFTQAGGSEGRREGVGLGLAIVRELVTLHRGRVWAESEPGKGSAFRFTLPLVEADSLQRG